jgi:hypothetical protein
MSKRPATRADIRAIAWWYLRVFSAGNERSVVDASLDHLAILDADERDDPEAAAIVAYWLSWVTVDCEANHPRWLGTRATLRERVRVGAEALPKHTPPCLAIQAAHDCPP